MTSKYFSRQCDKAPMSSVKKPVDGLHAKKLFKRSRALSSIITNPSIIRWTEGSIQYSFSFKFLITRSRESSSWVINPNMLLIVSYISILFFTCTGQECARSTSSTAFLAEPVISADFTGNIPACPARTVPALLGRFTLPVPAFFFAQAQARAPSLPPVTRC
jgi:hypothetical protein